MHVRLTYAIIHSNVFMQYHQRSFIDMYSRVKITEVVVVVVVVFALKANSFLAQVD